MRCGLCGHSLNIDCKAGVVDPEGDPSLAYTCLNLDKPIVELKASSLSQISKQSDDNRPSRKK